MFLVGYTTYVLDVMVHLVLKVGQLVEVASGYGDVRGLRNGRALNTGPDLRALENGPLHLAATSPTPVRLSIEQVGTYL